MVAVRKQRTASSFRHPTKPNYVDSFSLLQNSFSSKKVFRKSPLVSGLHKATDGALLGILITVAFMSGLTLHWQHLWTVAYTRLENTRELSHRLRESTARVERHFLGNSAFPRKMVPTKAANILYLKRPKESSGTFLNIYSKLERTRAILPTSVSYGY